MATAFKWASFTSRGAVLTTELNALANNGFSAAGPAFDNTTTLDEYAVAEVNLASLLPTTGGTVTLFVLESADGTNYEDAPSSTNPGTQMAVGTATLSVATSAKKVSIGPFRLLPQKMKFVLLNSAGAALGATGNTVTLYTGNEQGV